MSDTYEPPVTPDYEIDEDTPDWTEALQERADEERHAQMYDGQPEGDFSGASEDETWGGR